MTGAIRNGVRLLVGLTIAALFVVVVDVAVNSNSEEPVSLMTFSQINGVVAGIRKALSANKATVDKLKVKVDKLNTYGKFQFESVPHAISSISNVHARIQAKIANMHPPQGPRGNRGKTGKPGLRGFRGPRGRTGAVGRKGRHGATGYAGKAGTIGKNGRRGKNGRPGPRGATGPRGAPGKAGRTGPVGRRGAVGPAGRKGQTGVRGHVGHMGKKGLRGATGPVGYRGYRGFVGRRGVRGKKGYTGRPGKEGLRGASGVRGFPGAIGSRGKRGPRGITGHTGVRGKTGHRGHKGPRGFRGKKGLRGFRGPFGKRGLRGKKGRAGANGRNGKNGRKGVNGRAGTNGRRGPRGNKGARGHKGPLGFPGRKGRRGHRGHRGIRGAKGFRGPAGHRGPRGPRGPRGRPGPGGRGRRHVRRRRVRRRRVRRRRVRRRGRGRFGNWRAPKLYFGSRHSTFKTTAHTNHNMIKRMYFRAHRPAGYCFKSVTGFKRLNNQNVCRGRKNKNIAYRFAGFFSTRSPMRMRFRIGSDFGRGGMGMLDGRVFKKVVNRDLWWKYRWNDPAVRAMTSGYLYMRPGRHVLNYYGFEGCCDGAASIQYQIKGRGGWKLMTVTNLFRDTRSVVTSRRRIAVPRWRKSVMYMGTRHSTFRTTRSTTYQQGKRQYYRSRRPHGYCFKRTSGFKMLSNQNFCHGPNKNLVYRYVTYFSTSRPGKWRMRIGSDFGRGGFGALDGRVISKRVGQDLWWAYHWNSNKVMTSHWIFLQPGRHKLEYFGFEGCCDGKASIQYQKAGKSWTDLTKHNIDRDTKPGHGAPGFKYTNARQLKKSPHYGGHGGRPFDCSKKFKAGKTYKIKSMSVRTGALVDRFDVEYTNGMKCGAGGHGGGARKFTFLSNEYVRGFQIRTGALIDRMVIITNRRTLFFGGGNGGHARTFFAPPGHEVVAFYGRSGALMDQWGAVYAKK